jgi:undecaprenyl-diphosphatase
MPAFISLVILGIIQGITEFIPVSSSGHLVLSKFLLGFPSEGVLLEVVLHIGTLVPILIFYRKRILTLANGLFRGSRESWQLAILLVVATIPAVLLHLAARTLLEQAYQTPLVTASALCVTGLILIIPVQRKQQTTEITLLQALGMGIAQSFAMLPGISRSGTTIMIARHLGIPPAKAAEFSFFMAIPVLVGAVLLEIPRFGDYVREGVPITGLAVGMLTAAIFGYIALNILIRMLAKGKFWVFGIYCLALGGAALIFIL